MFWGWQIVVGTLVPVLLLVLPTRHDPRWVALAGFLIAAGLFGLQLNIVIPGLAVKEIHGLTQAVASMRVNPHYFPSLMEWLVTAWVIGLGTLLFGFGEILLPQTKEESEDVPVR